MSEDDKLRAAIRACTIARKSDMFSYSGPMYTEHVNHFIMSVLERRKRDNAVIVMTTYGGDAHAAYRLARFLQELYKTIRLVVIGPCKSAGTLVTLCAHDIAFGPFGELGPLDIQVTKKDDLVSQGSGLDTFQALAILRTYAFNAFEESMLDIISRSGGAISTKTACEIASQLVTGLFNPIAAQIDPQRMGEMQRMMAVAKAYGERLGAHNLKEGALEKLVEGYPSHAFIIDQREARSLFKKVSTVTRDELAVITTLEQKGACVMYPSNDIVTFDVSSLIPGDEGGENEAATKRVDTDTEPHDRAEQPVPPQDGGTAGRRRGKKRSQVRTPEDPSRALPS